MGFRPEDNWVESAHAAPADGIRVSISQQGFTALIGGAEGIRRSDSPETVALHIPWDLQAQLVASETILPIWVRGLRPFALPFQQQDGPDGQTIQEARFVAQTADYGVWVNRAYLAATGQSRDQLAVAVRRWAETGCDAYQLNDALQHTAQRQSPGATARIATLALRLRQRISATVWSGPPLRAEDDQVALDLLMAESWVRIVCGDTTAQIAARLLGKPLRVEQSAENRSQVPPLAYLEGINLVTEGVITLRHALEWLQGARTVRDLPRSADAAARLAHALLSADQLHFLVGRAVNRAQVDGEEAPARQRVIEELAKRLTALGRLVDIRYF
jgi:hypothetical protein